MEFKKASEFKQGLVKLLLYGHPGSGKTTFAATAPKVLIALTEPNGLLSIRERNPDATIVTIEKVDDLRELIEWLRDNPNHGYETVVLDSLTDAQTMIISEVVSRKADREIPSQNDWQVIIDKTAKLAKAFRDLPVNTIVICTAQEYVLEEDGTRMVRPAVSGRRLPNQLAGYFSIVAYAYKRPNRDGEGIEYLICTEHDEKIVTKGHRALDRIEKPDFQEWVKKIMQRADGMLQKEIELQKKREKQEAKESKDQEKEKPAKSEKPENKTNKNDRQGKRNKN